MGLQRRREMRSLTTSSDRKAQAFGMLLQRWTEDGGREGKDCFGGRWNGGKEETTKRERKRFRKKNEQDSLRKTDI